MRIDVPAGEGEEAQRMWRMQPALGKAVYAFGDTVQDETRIPVRELEAARIRIAHINGCVPCSEARIADMEKYGLDDSFYDDVDDPARRGRNTERERLGIEFSERFAAGAQTFDDAFWKRMRSAYADAEMLDLATCCSKWLGLGRLNAGLEVEVSCPIQIAPSRNLEPVPA